ncbi:hypothetical protein RAC89_11895 [Paenibacillus sp. GD4]|jgi:hypothetical protein|uniref:hypothetical protein n=1 Tax=Paenibacillus TaxID=44249 RepID=UPI002542DC39|nr:MULTISPECIES: hypothetical protein [Paenibacillus]MDQ1911155.1 hypothetical protein [Paenibacillus sp. GD4]
MESLCAAFPNPQIREQAVEALRAQGAIDIRLDEVVEFSKDLAPYGMVQGYKLEVVVESSRREQAADTISRYGGQL